MNPAASGLPFDDIRNLLGNPPPMEAEAVDLARRRLAMLALGEGGLGRLGDLAVWLAGWQAAEEPQLRRPLIAIFAGSHGVAAKGASDFAPGATQAMMEVVAGGGAAVNQIALQYDAGLKMFDLALDLPTPDITQADALEEDACAATMAFGMEAIAGGTDLLCVGALGVGGRVPAAAIAAKLVGGNGRDWIDGEGALAARRIALVDAVLAHHAAIPSDPLEVLRRLGGRELAAIAGAIIASRYQRIPVLLDGFVSGAAALVLERLAPGMTDHCLAASASATPAHDRLLAVLGKEPLFRTGITLDDGTAAASGIGLLRSAAAILNGMAEAEQAGIATT